MAKGPLFPRSETGAIQRIRHRIRALKESRSDIAALHERQIRIVAHVLSDLLECLATCAQYERDVYLCALTEEISVALSTFRTFCSSEGQKRSSRLEMVEVAGQTIIVWPVSGMPSMCDSFGSSVEAQPRLA